jgi:hypothetical protein
VCDASGIEADVTKLLEDKGKGTKAIVFFKTPLENFKGQEGKFRGVYTRGLNLCYLRALGDINSPYF